LKDRRYLVGVSPVTMLAYRQAFHAFRNCTALDEYQARIIELRERGLSPVSVNDYIRCANAFL